MNKKLNPLSDSTTTISIEENDCQNIDEEKFEKNPGQSWLRSQDPRIMAIYLVNFLISCIFSLVPTFFPSVAREKGVSQSWVGIIFSANPAASFFCSFALGKWMRFCGRKKLVIFGIVLQVFCSAGLGFLNFIKDERTFLGLAIATRLMQGLATNFFSTTSYAIIPILYPDNVQQKIGNLEATTGLGIMFGPFMGAAFYFLFGYEAPFLWMAFLFALVIPFTMKALPSDDQLQLIIEKQKNDQLSNEEAQQRVQNASRARNNEKVPLGVLKFLFTRQIFALFLVLCMFSINLSYVTPVIADHMEGYGIGPSLAGVFFFIVTTGYILTIKLVTVCLVPRLDRKIIISLGICLSCFTHLLLGPEPGLFPHLLAINILGQILLGPSQALQYITTVPELLSLGGKVYPHDEEGVSDLSSGILQGGCAFGNMVGPFIGGILTDYFNFYATARIISLANAGILVFYLIAGDALIAIIRKILCKEAVISDKRVVLNHADPVDENLFVNSRNLSMQIHNGSTTLSGGE